MLTWEILEIWNGGDTNTLSWVGLAWPPCGIHACPRMLAPSPHAGFRVCPENGKKRQPGRQNARPGQMRFSNSAFRFCLQAVLLANRIPVRLGCCTAKARQSILETDFRATHQAIEDQGIANADRVVLLHRLDELGRSQGIQPGRIGVAGGHTKHTAWALPS